MPLYENIAQAISPQEPCGPDPELNPEVLSFLSVAEGQLPASYREFDRKALNAKPILENLEQLLAKSRDIRFPVLGAKYSILSDNVLGFAEAITATATLLSAQWDACHPTDNAGGAPLRAAYVKTLDDLPTSVLPLQNATLIQDKRIGPITWRTVLVADGKLAARAGEKALDSGSVADALMRHEPAEDITQLRDGLASIGVSLKNIRQQFIDKAGYEVAPQFDELPQMSEAIVAYLDAVTGMPVAASDDAIEPAAQDQAEVTAESASAPAAAATGSTAVASVKEASNALAAILSYYAGAEPSSPARLLVKQAHQLVGKSFVEAMKILAPKLAEQSKIQITGDAPFTLDFARLSALAGDDAAPQKSDAPAREYSAKTRVEATELMRQVEQFYRRTEPSSPIPLLVERARNFVAKDFATLMKEMMGKPNEK